MPSRTRVALIAAAALTAMVSPATALAQTKLIATVGSNDAHVITLVHENGAPVNDIPAGTYTIEVRDRSRIHNFHLFGPGVDRETTIAGIGTETWTVTLRNEARYTYLCDAHPVDMRDTFTTGGGPPPQPPPPPPLPRVGSTLYATVGPGFTISFRTRRGSRISRLRAGRYRIVVRDRSSSHNFHLTGRAVNKRTSVAFRGTVTWTVRLRRGTYRFVCDPHRLRMRGSFRVV